VANVCNLLAKGFELDVNNILKLSNILFCSLFDHDNLNHLSHFVNHISDIFLAFIRGNLIRFVGNDSGTHLFHVGTHSLDAKSQAVFTAILSENLAKISFILLDDFSNVSHTISVSLFLA